MKYALFAIISLVSFSTLANEFIVNIMDEKINEEIEQIILKDNNELSDFLNEIKKPEYKTLSFRFKINEADHVRKGGGDGGDDG